MREYIILLLVFIFINTIGGVGVSSLKTQEISEFKNISLPANYTLSYRQTHEYQGLTDYVERFQFYLNKNYTISNLDFLQRKFQQVKGIYGVDFSEYYLIKQQPYITDNYSSPIYGNVEKILTQNNVLNFSNTPLSCVIGTGNNTFKKLVFYQANITINSSVVCFNSYANISNNYSITYNDWESIDYANMTAYKEELKELNKSFLIGQKLIADKIYEIEFRAHKKPELGDVAIYINHSFLDTELEGLSWWTSTFSKKIPVNCSKMSDKTAFVVNGSNGFMISGQRQIVHTYCSGTGTSVYYNNYTNYAVANDTTQLPLKVEVGNGSSYNSGDVWGANAWTVYLFNEQTGGTINDSSNAKNNARCASPNTCNWIQNTQIGGGVLCNITNLDYIAQNEITTLANQNFTVFAVVNSTQIGSDYDTIISRNKQGSYQWALMTSSGAINNWSTFSNDGYNYGGQHIPNITYYLAFVFNGTHSRLYTNDTIEVDWKPGSYPTAGKNTTICRFYDNLAGSNWGGTISEIRIYNRTWTLEEVNETFRSLERYSGFGNLLAEEPMVLFSIILNSPANNTYTNDNTPDFNITTIGTEANYNCTLWIDNLAYGNATATNNTAITITANATLSDGVKYWNITGTSGSVSNFSEMRILTIDTTNPSISFISPTETNNTFWNRNFIAVNVSVTEQNEANITFYLFNSTTTLNSTTYSAGTRGVNFTNLDSNMQYWYNVTVRDLAGNVNNTETRNITLDSSYPIINLTSPSDGDSTTETSFILKYNLTETNPNFCELWDNYSAGGDIVFVGVGYNNTSPTNNATNNFTRSYGIGTWRWNVRCYDKAGNSNFSTNRSFTITTAGGEGGGGGGGGGVVEIINITPTVNPYTLTPRYLSSEGIDTPAPFNFSQDAEERTYLFSNNLKKEITVSIEIIGYDQLKSPNSKQMVNTAHLITLSEQKFNVGIGQRDYPLKITARIRPDLKGVFSVRLLVKSENYTETINGNIVAKEKKKVIPFWNEVAWEGYALGNFYYLQNWHLITIVSSALITLMLLPQIIPRKKRIAYE